MAITLTNDNFNNEVLKFDGVVLVDFWADWCGPCKMLGPIIEEVSEEVKGEDKMKVAKLNVDENSALAQEYGIMSIPCLKFFKGGEIVEEMVGLQDKETILDKLRELSGN